MLLVAPSGSYRIAPYVSAAAALGMGIIVVSNSQHSLVAAVATGIAVDFSSPEQAFATIIGETSSLNVACVLATDDSCVELCSRLASYLELPHNSPRAAELTHRKDLAREALRRAGCNTPRFQVLPIDQITPQLVTIAYPLVLKPLGLSASRGVIRVDSDAALVAASRRIDAILESSGLQGFTRDHLLIESYIDGAEYAVEGFIVDGQFQLLTIFDKPEPLSGPYFEETYYLTPGKLVGQAKQDLLDEVSRCCSAYGLRQGPVHAEARIAADGRVTLLELAARTIGGQCGQLIEFSLQHKLEELVIQGMCGQLPDLHNKAESAGVLMIPVTDAGILKRVEGLTEAMQIEYVRDIEIHIRPGYELIPLPEGASYLGFIFAQAPDYEQTYTALKQAYASLRFITQAKWDIESMAG